MVTTDTNVANPKRRPRSGSLPIIITPEIHRDSPVMTRLLEPTAGVRRQRADSECKLSTPEIKTSLPSLSKSLDHLPTLSMLGPKTVPRQRRHGRVSYYDLESNTNKPETGDLRRLGVDIDIQENIDDENHLSVPNANIRRRYVTQNSTPSVLEDGFHLPPLPSGSLTFQSVLRDLYFSGSDSNNSSGDESSGEDGNASKCQHWKKPRKSKLAWYGPIVEYKGNHIFLSTLDSLNTTMSRYGVRKWCN